MTLRTTFTLSIAAASALALASCSGGETVGGEQQSAAVAKTAPPAGSTWSANVTPTSEGGFVMGNPQAPIRLIEYGSLTCPACAAFSTASKDELTKNFVDTGQVAFEFRNFLRNPVDALAGTVITCTGKDLYYPLTENTYASMDQLMAGTQNIEQVAQSIQSLPDNRKWTTYARGIGLYEFFSARGVSEGEINQCLSNPANVAAMERRSNAAVTQFKVAGTPTFVLNGTVVENGNTWPVIRDKLRAAGAR